jgi:iron complex outermembrane receptor protein
MPTLFEDYVHQTIFLNGPLDDLDNWRIATENLDPQRIDSYELGYLANLSRYGLSLDVRLFRERLTDIIDDLRDLDIPDPDRDLTDSSALALLDNFIRYAGQYGAFTYANSAEIRIQGVELNLQYKPSPADLIFIGYSYLDAEGSELRRIGGGEPTFTSDELGHAVPDHTFSLLASHRFANGFQISSGYTFVDNLEWPGDGDEVPSYSRWDLRFAKTLNANGWDGEISLLLQNIGEKNVDFFEDNETGQINQWDTRAFLQASLNFY